MSRYFPGEQVEHAFAAHRLCNWEVPKKDGQQKVSASHPFDTLRGRNGKTEFIVDEKGHLLPGTQKLPGSSFNLQPQVFDKTYARWPQPNPAIPAYQAATMGYKGIKTNYLPGNTVALKAVDVPHDVPQDGNIGGKYKKEYNYNFM